MVCIESDDSPELKDEVKIIRAAIKRPPNIPSLICLSMKNCTIHSMFHGDCGANAPLSKLLLSRAIIEDVVEAFCNVEVNHMTFLDIYIWLIYLQISLFGQNEKF